MFNNLGVNKVFLVGHIDKEPRLHKGVQAQDEWHFNLATTEYIRKGSEQLQHTEWHNVKIPVTHPSLQDKNLRKGQLVHISGKIQTKTWVDQEQIKRYKTEILALQLEVLSEVA